MTRGKSESLIAPQSSILLLLEGLLFTQNFMGCLFPSAVDKSLMKAKEFFTEYYPNLANAEYRCHSWLLDSKLKGMLNENSNIISFQNRFDIFDVGEADTEFIDWLYNTKSTDYSALPENTSLQRNMKRHLLSGGVIRNAYGRLKYF